MGCCCARRRATSREERAEERAIFATERRQEYYAIRRGRGCFRGVVKTWAECADLVLGVRHNVFRKFRTLEEAREFAFACEVVAESSCEAEYLALRRRSEVARHLEQGQEE